MRIPAAALIALALSPALIPGGAAEAAPAGSLAQPVPTGERPGSPSPVSSLPTPRFVSLKFNEIIVREGPSRAHQEKYTYNRARMPVEVTAEHDVWRRIRDFEGDQGWVLQSQLDGERNGLVTGTGRVAMRATDSEDAAIVAYAEPGVIGALERCTSTWCALEVQGVRGWLPKARLWGVYPAETIE